MKNFFEAILKYIRFYPDAKLCFIYTLKAKSKDGSKLIVHTQDKRFVKKFKHDKEVEIKRKLVCRTLY